MDHVCANRVCRIQENVGKARWLHVKSEHNPADLGSRGNSLIISVGGRGLIG